MQSSSLFGCKVIVAGGDARDIVLAQELARMGGEIWLYGHTNCTDTGSLRHGLPESADVIILPLPGLDNEGNIYTRNDKIHIRQLEQLLFPGTLVLAGRMPDSYVAELTQAGAAVILTAEIDELAIYNAVPTAEGAIEVAMRESLITIHGSNALVTGFGRCGLPLAKTLMGLGANVTVAARRREVLAMAEALDFRAVPFASLCDYAGEFQFVFNTVPEMVINEPFLAKCQKDVVVVDIASAPGGTDFAAAKELGIKSFLSLGLPGKVAPVSAGKILSKVYPYLISKHWKGGERN